MDKAKVNLDTDYYYRQVLQEKLNYIQARRAQSEEDWFMSITVSEFEKLARFYLSHKSNHTI